MASLRRHYALAVGIRLIDAMLLRQRKGRAFHMFSQCAAVLTFCSMLVVQGPSAPAPLKHQSWFSARDSFIVLANAYGDTVWFGSGEVHGEEERYVSGNHSYSAGPLLHVTAWGVTAGTPIAFVMPWSEPLREARSVVESLCAKPRLPHPGGFPIKPDDIVAIQPDPWSEGERPSLYLWDVGISMADTSVVRMIFVVAGVPDTSRSQEAWARRRSASDPVPIRTDASKFIRFASQLSAAHIRATARVVGEVSVDLKRRRVIQPTEPGGGDR